MDIIIGYPHFQSINFGKSLSICQRLFAIFKWKDIIMLSVTNEIPQMGVVPKRQSSGTASYKKGKFTTNNHGKKACRRETKKSPITGERSKE